MKNFAKFRIKSATVINTRYGKRLLSSDYLWDEVPKRVIAVNKVRYKETFTKVHSELHWSNHDITTRR